MNSDGKILRFLADQLDGLTAAPNIYYRQADLEKCRLIMETISQADLSADTKVTLVGRFERLPQFFKSCERFDFAPYVETWLKALEPQPLQPGDMIRRTSLDLGIRPGLGNDAQHAIR